MTSNAKKWAALGVAVLVLGVGAGIFLQQTKTRVEAEVRAALASLPGVAQHSVESVQFDVLSQTLTLKNLHMVFTEKDNTSEVTLGEVVAVKPNPNALKGGDGGTLLAEEVRISNYVATATVATLTIDAQPTHAVSRLNTMRFVQPHADIPGLMNLTVVDGKPLDAAKGLKALASLKAASVQYGGMTVDVTAPEIPPIRLTLDSMDCRDITIVYTGSATFKNWGAEVKGMGSASVGSMEITALTVPDLSKLPPELLSATTSEKDAEALLAALMKSMPKDKPMLGNLTLRDVKESFSGGNVSLQRLSVDNFWYEPRQVGLALEGLSIPTRLLPTPVVGMLGYERLNMSGDLSLRPLADKMTQLSTSLDVQDAGKVHLRIDVKGDVPAPTASREDVNKLLLESLKFSYLDKGLAGRGVHLAQGAMNWGPEMITQLAQASAADIIGNDPEAIKQLMNFVEKPGEITITIKPDKPMPLGQLEQKLTSADMRVTSVPGPKTLQELAKP